VSPDKLPFLNHQHILRKLSTLEGTKSLVATALPFLKDHLTPSYSTHLNLLTDCSREMPSQDHLMAVLRVSQERMHTLKDVYGAGPYFFTEPDYSVVKLWEFRKRHPTEVVGITPLNCQLIVTRWSSAESPGENRRYTRLGSGQNRRCNKTNRKGTKSAVKDRNANFKIRDGRLGIRRWSAGNYRNSWEGESKAEDRGL